MKYAPYSFSKIQTFFNCQKKFEFTYVNKILIDRNYQDPSYFKRGRFLHAYISNRLNGGDGSEMSRYNVETNDKLHLIECANIVLENEYINITFNFDVTEIEKPIKLDYNLIATNEKGYALNGYIDYFAIQDNLGVIVDWKSGKYHSKPNFNQLELYSIWILQNYPQVDEIDLIFYYVEHDKFVLKTVSIEEIIKFRENLFNQISLIELTEEFHTNESKRCYDCPFLNTCMEKYDIIGL